MPRINHSSGNDLLLINPDSSSSSYQGLATDYAAIEPPTWALLLAQSCRAKGFEVQILDCAAERLTVEQSLQRIGDIAPRLVCFVVYGQNPNSGTTNMSGAVKLGAELKTAYPEYPICFVGSHTSALPRQVLNWEFVDFVLLNEGVYALINLLGTDLVNDLNKINGVGFKENGHLILNEPERIVPPDRMDLDLPGYAWDLLPYLRKPLDLYRAHFWHAEFDHNKRTPFAAIYTSLGCRFSCNFCMINILNRNSNRENVSAADSRGMRFWSPGFVFNQINQLAEMGVSTIRISDEMFFLDRRYFEPLLENLSIHDLGLRMWAYSRVDTVKEKYIDLFLKAGIKWLALGIEAGNTHVRRQVSKGSFKELNIREVCSSVRSEGMNIISNYIFGLPEDDINTMQHTLDLALDLNTEMANMYPCMALPGSPVYWQAVEQGWKLPDTFEGYGFLSYECEPLPTNHLTSSEVLRFRDQAWQTYFTNPNYLELVEKKFGQQERINLENMAKIKLKRRILGD